MKKKISLLLAAATLMGSLTMSAFAADKTTFTDVKSDTQYSEAILTLVKLGVINGYEDNTFKPEGGITRAEFSAIITRAMNIADGVGGTSPFTDVAETHWAAKNIIAATDRGITNGMGDGTFAPDANVTYEQAVKMIVCALNYTTAAEALGGWPNGYFDEGVLLGLTKEVAASTIRTNPAPRGVVAQLMYNALDIKVADAKNSVATDDTFLNKFLNMEIATGKVVGVEDDITAEYNDTLDKDEMVIKAKGNEFISIDFAGFEDHDSVKDYLGKEVVVFYTLARSGGMNQLVVLDSEMTENDTTEINSKDINSYSNGTIGYYNESGNRKTIDFNVDDVTVFYNKKAVTVKVDEKLEEWLDPSNEDTFLYGSVILTDSGSDKSIDMVEIMDYDYLVALRAPSTSDYKVTNKMKFKTADSAVRVIDSVTLNPDKNSYTFTITDEKGTSMQTTGIKANNVVLVAASENEDAFTVKVSSKTVEGDVRSFSASENIIQIDNEEYTITDDCVAYIADQGKSLERGVTGKFYLDAFGNIAYADVNIDTETMTVAYVLKAIYDEDNDNGTLRVFVPGSGEKSYTISERVILNGNSNVSVGDVIDHLKENAENFTGDAYRAPESVSGVEAYQIAKLEIENNEIKKVITMNMKNVKDEETDEIVEYYYGTTSDSSKLKTFYKEPKTFKYSSGTFTSTKDSDKFFTNSSTVFISIPKDRNEVKSYYKRTSSYFSKTETYYVEPINVNDSKIAEIVLIYSSVSKPTVTGGTPISVLAKAPGTVMSGDDVLDSFELYTNNNTLKEVAVDEEENVNDMTVGDIFRYVASSEGHASDIRLKISYADIKDVLEEKDTDYDWNGKSFSWDNPYEVQDNSGRPYSSANVYNVASIDENGESIFVTKDGFVDGKLPEDAETFMIEIEDDTKFLKMSANGKELLTIDEESEVELTIDDLASAEYADDECSKIAVITYNGDIKLIVIYE